MKSKVLAALLAAGLFAGAGGTASAAGADILLAQADTPDTARTKDLEFGVRRKIEDEAQQRRDERQADRQAVRERAERAHDARASEARQRRSERRTRIESMIDRY